jgi:large subunit ribosomal protein L4
MELSVYNIKGKETGKTISLSEEVFGIKPNEHVIWLDVKHFLAAQRQGTHKAKERAEVSRTTKKFKKQKGTGGARAGSLKSPVQKGGGTVFGPRVRDYDFKLNKKVKTLARKSAFSDKAQAGKIAVLDGISFESPKTKEFIEMLNAFNFGGSKTLVILPTVDKNVVLSGRNVPKNQVTTVDSLNTYDLVNADQLIIIEAAVEKLTTALTK